MSSSRLSSRLVLVLSLALSLLVALASAAPNRRLLSPRQRFSLMKRQMGNYPVVGVQSGSGNNGSVPYRLEIRELQKNADQWNLYLLGLERFQAADQSEMLSWYQIAGIHGRPHVDWDGVPAVEGQEDNGYCTHASTLFPTWHRPYLALYEQVLYNIIQDIASEFGGANGTIGTNGTNGTNSADGDRYRRAAETFRMPYWDWAVAPEGDGAVLPASVSSAEEIQVITPTGPRSIRNPLYQYNFHPVNTNEFPDQPVREWANTLRYPSDESPSAVSRNNLVEEQLKNNRLSYRDRLYNLFTAYDNYTEFSSKAWFPSDGGNYDSMESVHDQIHGLVGNGGHMSYIDYSAFDPIFFLHHTMMDRVFAMWQVLHPDTWVEPIRTEWGTRTIPRGATEDANTALTPFHSDGNGSFWTSSTIRSLKTFGYSYAELEDGGLSPEQLRNNVRAAVNRLYGRNAPATAPAARRLRRRSLDRRVPQDGKPENATQAGDDEAPEAVADEQVDAEGKYYEYIANIRVKKSALDTSFFVHVFVGDFNPDPFSWTFEPNLVGSHCVFSKKGEPCNCADDAAHDAEVTGAIPLTTALLAAIERGCLASLDPKDVDPYLKGNLHWRVSTLDDRVVPNEDVPGLKVSVVSSEVKQAESEQEFPQWGSLSIRDDITQDKATGHQPGEPE